MVFSILLGAVRRFPVASLLALCGAALSGCCQDAAITESFATTAVREGQVAVVGMRSANGTGCGCSPRAKGRGTPGRPFGITACGCRSILGSCSDEPYSIAVELGDLEPGAHQFFVNSRSAPFEVTVHPADQCVDGGVRVDQLALLGQNSFLPSRFFQPGAVWVEATGTISTCCPDAPPDVVITRLTSREVVVHELVAGTCGACDTVCGNPADIPFAATIPIVLPVAGAHQVFLATQLVSFQVE